MLNDELEVDLIFFKKNLKNKRIEQRRSQMTKPRAIQRLEGIHGRRL